MKKYIALLRGINVSGQKKILMSDLKILMLELNFENIHIYIQSGNIIFDFIDVNFKILENQISEKIKLKFGFDVVIIVKTPSDIESAITKNPFLKDVTKELNKIYVVFLSEKPAFNDINLLDNIDYSPEEFIIDDNIIYFYAPFGAGNSKLSTHFFEKKLNVNATARNWNTVNKLLELSKKN